MAKADTVYSLFGMKSPQQVAREQMLSSQKLLQSQRDPYARLGTALGMGLGRLFGGANPEMQRSKQFQDIVAQAKGDVTAQRAEQEEQAQAQLDERLGGLEGAILSEETGRGALPEIKKPELSREEQMMRTFEDDASRFDAMATRLDAVPGFEAQAEAARNKATESRLKVFGLQKTLADIQKAQRGAAPKFQEIKEGNEIVTYRVDADGTRTVVARAERYKPTDPASIAAAVYKGSQEQVLDKEAMKYYIESYAENNKAAASARKTFTSTEQMEKLLDAGILTGKLSDIKLVGMQLLQDIGAIDSPTVANTEQFVKTAARQTVALLASGVFGTAQSITDNDRKFAEGMAGGDTTATAETIRTLIDINRYYAKMAFEQQRRGVDQAKNAFPKSNRVKEVFQPQYFNGEQFEVPIKGPDGQPTGQIKTVEWDETIKKFKDV